MTHHQNHRVDAGLNVAQTRSELYKAVLASLIAIGGIMSAAAHADTLLYEQALEYDELGRLIAERGNAYPGQGAQAQLLYTYDNEGRVTKIVDAQQRSTEMKYDALGRLREVTDAARGVTTYAYNKDDRITKVIDPRKLVTSYDYDGFGQMWKQGSPDSGITQYNYALTGLLTKTTRADGQRVDYNYDGLGRLRSYGQGADWRTFSYDNCTNGKGRMCAASASGASQTSADVYFTYMPDGQLASRRDVITDWTGNTEHSVQYGYDGLGRLTSIVYPNDIAVGYGYSQGRLSAMTANIHGVAKPVVSNVQYQPFGGVESWQYGNGLTRRYNRDLDGRITGVSVGTDASVVQSLTYGYNPSNEIIAITNGMNAALSQTYEYDAMSRLKRSQRTGYDEQYTYDANGNRIAHIINGAPPPPMSGAIPGRTIAYAYASGSNRLMGTSGERGDNTSYAYNAQGQRSRQMPDDSVEQSYQYDAFNRMVGVGLYQNTDTTYTYNALDQQVAESGPFAPGTHFVYQGQNQLLAEISDGIKEQTNYLWFGGELVGLVRGYGELTYVHPDHLGRPEVVTDGNRQPVWRAANYAFTREVLHDNISGLNLGFPGQRLDEAWGFWHNGYRDFDAKIGGYLQTDPAGLQAGINTYLYASANPISNVDPLGLDDFNLIPAGEPMHGWVNKYSDGKNILSIAVHARPGRFLVNGELLTGKELFEQMKKNPEFMSQLAAADAVQLNSCRAGKEDDEGYNAAQDFANAAGKPTYAPKVWNWRRPNGTFFIGGAIRGQSKNGWDFGHEGNFIFLPGKGP